MSVAFFDLDRTVLDCNWGALWIAEEWRTKRLGLRQVLTGMYWLGRYKLGHDGLEYALHEAAALYRGMREEEMTALVEGWFERLVRHRARPGALAAIDAHRFAGDALVLATSSSHFAAECAQRAFGFDEVVATRLEVAQGVLTGLVTDLAYGAQKLALCERWAVERGVPLAACTFYTDSITDLPLLEKVGRPVVVAPDRRLSRVARQRGWEVVDWGCTAT